MLRDKYAREGEREGASDGDELPTGVRRRLTSSRHQEGGSPCTHRPGVIASFKETDSPIAGDQIRRIVCADKHTFVDCVETHNADSAENDSFG
jgi:hypothetical protein